MTAVTERDPLPSSDAIELAAVGQFDADSIEHRAFVAGALWMREQAAQQLAPYLEADARAIFMAARVERITDIVSELFPRYDSRAAHKDPWIRPPQWHDKSFWWNGASVEDHDDFGEGDVNVDLTSYVGGGETDRVSVVVYAAWMDAPQDQWRGLVAVFKAEKVKERDTARLVKEAEDANRQIAKAHETLRRLGALRSDQDRRASPSL